MDDVRSDDAEVSLYSKGGKGVVARRVERVVMVEKLDNDAFSAEAVDEPIELSSRRDRAGFDEGFGHCPLAATGEGEEVASCELGQSVEVVSRAPLLAAGKMALSEGPGEAGVTGGVASDDDQVGPGRIWGPGARGGLGRKARAMAGEGELGPKDGGHSHLFCRLGETHHTIETVVISQRQSAEP
jgi:hypothetical protein